MVCKENRANRPSSRARGRSPADFVKAAVCAITLSALTQGAAAQQSFSPNFGALEQPTGDRSYRPSIEVTAHGVVLATGNKVESETDFTAQGEMPLFLRRTYNHHWSANGLFGHHWLSNFDYSLATSISGADTLLWLQRPDGRRIKFIPSGQANRWNEDKPSSIAYLVKNGDGTYSLTNEDRGTELYSADGYILERRNEHGIAWTFAYTGKYLQRVTHSSQRSIQFIWTGNQLTQVLDPAGNPYTYSYTANAFGTGHNRLATVTLPASPSTVVSYHYDDARFPGGLTGKAFNGARYSTFTYNADGRVEVAELAGGVERYTYQYAGGIATPVTPPPLPPAPGGQSGGEGGEPGGGGWCEYQSGSRICFQPRFAGSAGGSAVAAMGLSALSSFGVIMAAASATSTPFTVTETNPLGKQTVYTFTDDRLVSVSRLQSSKTPAAYRERAYDANGYETAVSDFTNGLTGYQYDAHGHLLSSVDGSGTPLARTTSYTWDESKNRVVTATVAGVSETTYAYAADGRIARIDVKNLSAKGTPNAILSTIFTYTKHGNGLPATIAVDGPAAGSGDRIVSTYNEQGDLVSVRNDLGHTTTYSGYNQLGLVGTVTGPNGEQTDYVYDARGRRTSIRPIVNGTAQPTIYSYDGFGRLTSVQSPDGSAQNLMYDAAWRLAEEYQREPAGTWARKVNTFDAMSQQTKVEIHRSSFPSNTRVIGNIDGTTSNGSGGFNLQGWACSTGQNAPIDVHVYLGGAYPSGTLAGAFVSNQPSDGGIASQCQANGTAYRFVVPLTDALRDQYGGSHIYVHGISPAAKANELLANSGSFAVPRLLPNAAPSGLTGPARIPSSTFTISWNPVARATRYKLEESSDGMNWSPVHDAVETNKVIDGKGGGTYRYRVSGCNETGCGPLSNVIAVERVVAPTTAPTPSAPGVNDVGSYTVSVSQVTGATFYVIDQSANGGAWGQAHNGAATSVSLSGRNTTIDHQYRTRACNEAGCGPTSGVITVQRAIYGAQYLGQAVFGLSLPGHWHTVTVYMRNTGNTTWTAGNAYNLGSQNPGDNWTWGLHRVAVSGSVAPGATATFTFSVRAPGSTGYHNFQWRMVRDGYAWFGDQTPNTVIEVATANIWGDVGRCPLYIGESTCSIVVHWTSTRSDAQVWISDTDGSNWQLFSPQRSGAVNAPWISLTPKRFYVIAAGVVLASIDLEAYQLNEYRPDPDPPGGCTPNPPHWTCDPV